METLFQNNISNARLPLSLMQLRRLYDLTDWGIVGTDPRVNLYYSDYASINLMKAWVLPFLINISSDRALERELKERASLQTLCGFIPGERIPSRGTLWNFRDKYKDVFSDILIRIFISMVLSENSPNYNLPFVLYPIDDDKLANQVFDDEDLFVGSYKIKIRKYMRKKNSGIKDIKSWVDRVQGKDLVEYRRSLKSECYQLRQDGIIKELDIPIEVCVNLPNNEMFVFAIDVPEWIRGKKYYNDTLYTLGSSHKKPYTACNIIVLNNNGKILLSKRISGYGKGFYTLPGGKRDESLDESLEQCAIRELKQETGLLLKNSRPVSIQYTNMVDQPRVLSIGVLAEDYEGNPRTLEPYNHEKWQWYNLTDLPQPLFEPTKIAITQYVQNKYSNLKWDDIEKQNSLKFKWDYIEENNKKSKQLNLFENNNGKYI